MSRIGKQPITVPSSVTVTLDGQAIKVKGSKGELDWTLPEEVTGSLEGEVLTLKRKGDTPNDRAKHGLARAIVQNMVTGVSDGFKKILEINGVGYRAQVSGKKLTLNLGFSHPIDFPIPEGITIEMDPEAKNKNTLIISGIDKQMVGEVAANIRKFRLPEPYKGKGIKYHDEHIQRKAGKAAGKEA